MHQPWNGQVIEAKWIYGVAKASGIFEKVIDDEQPRFEQDEKYELGSIQRPK